MQKVHKARQAQEPHSNSQQESESLEGSESILSSDAQDISDGDFEESEGKDIDEDSSRSPKHAHATAKDRERPVITRSNGRPSEVKPYELRRELSKDKQRVGEQKQQREGKLQPIRKEDEKNLQVYIKIIDYLKKIEWDQQNAQNKMNPYHFMTAACFWFVVCAEYFSYNFFARRSPEEAIAEIMSKVNRINYPIPLRISKNALIDKSLLEADVQPTKHAGVVEKITDYLKDLIPNSHYDYIYEQNQRLNSLSDTTDDDVFRCTTRTMLYNYVKKHYDHRLDPYISAVIESQDIFGIEDKPKQLAEKMSIESPEEKVESPSDKAAEVQPNSNSTTNEKTKGPSTKDDILLESILNMPLDKAISILEAQIPLNRLPRIQEPMIPIPADPFQLIQMNHPLQQKFLDYLKMKRMKENMKEMASNTKLETVQGKNKFSLHPENPTDDAKCQICTDGDYTEDNLIVFCSKCNISLHQRCVGLVKVPTECWNCDVCMAFGHKGRWLRCALCTVKGGALKRTTISSDTVLFKETNPSYHEYLKGCSHNKSKEQYQPSNATTNTNTQKKQTEVQEEKQEKEVKEERVKEERVKEEREENEDVKEEKEENMENMEIEKRQPYQKEEDKDLYYDYYNPEQAAEQPPDCHYVWIHYTCAIWVPEVYFEERNGIINIKGLENVDKKRFKIMCQICQSSRAGACVKCAQESCPLHYHAECARKAGVYMEQRCIDKLEYFIYCNLHKPLKVSRVIESKNKKYKDEIIKFCRMIEKYVETYRIATVPFKLLKSSKKSGKNKKESRNRESKEDKESENQDFMRALKDYLLGNRKLVVSMKKVSDGYKVIDIEQPVKRALRTNIGKTDETWELFNYRNLNSSQLFKKYRRIMKENAHLRDSFVKEIRTHSKAERRRNSKSNDEKYVTVEQDPNQLYCICRKLYSASESMMECEVCGQWFHFKCIGFTGVLEDAQKIQFNCYRCQRYQSATAIEKRRLKNVGYFDPNFVPKYPEEDEMGNIIQKNEARTEEVIQEANETKMEIEQPIVNQTAQ